MNTTTRLGDYCRDEGIFHRENPPLSEYCTFKIGGPVKLLMEPSREEQIEALLKIAGEDHVPLLTLGKGSNMLFHDRGFDGAVLHLGAAFSGMRMVDDCTIDCDSGASLMHLCLLAWEKGLAGLEFAYGIPGSVGGAIFMNAGAYGGEMRDVLVSSRHICPRQGSGVLQGEAMELSYRHSAYSTGDRVITGGLFRLRPDDKDAIKARMDDYMGRRRAKQPLEYPSAGSTFKRPEGNYASALIDQCGLKGRRVGGAQVSEKHAGFVINAAGATGDDVRRLIALVQGEVKEKTGYHLACEVKIVD